MNTVVWKHLNQVRVPVHTIHTEWLNAANVSLDILRLDLLHPEISGNKWFKLKNHLLPAFENGFRSVLSFGGAWSNHIHALAAAGKHLGFPTIGVIRGERPERLSLTLQDAERWGMHLHFVTRKEYREKSTPAFQKSLLKTLGLDDSQVCIVPEGGAGPLGVKGCEEILSAGGIDENNYEQIWLAAGTGATSAGVIRSKASQTFVQCVAVLKGADWMKEDIAIELQSLQKSPQNNWEVDTQSHCGGYAKKTPELLHFIDSFYQEASIPLDPVYTGKMLFALYNKVLAGSMENTRVLALHTGGLQGARSL